MVEGKKWAAREYGREEDEGASTSEYLIGVQPTARSKKTSEALSLTSSSSSSSLIPFLASLSPRFSRTLLTRTRMLRTSVARVARQAPQPLARFASSSSLSPVSLSNVRTSPPRPSEHSLTPPRSSSTLFTPTRPFSRPAHSLDRPRSPLPSNQPAPSRLPRLAPSPPPALPCHSNPTQ